MIVGSSSATVANTGIVVNTVIVAIGVAIVADRAVKFELYHVKKIVAAAMLIKMDAIMTVTVMVILIAAGTGTATTGSTVIGTAIVTDGLIAGMTAMMMNG